MNFLLYIINLLLLYIYIYVFYKLKDNLLIIKNKLFAT